MDTIQLTVILSKDKFRRGVFQGAYPSDKLPGSVSQYPALFMANVDTVTSQVRIGWRFISPTLDEKMDLLQICSAQI